uniref:Golgin subfamily A member 4 isoform X2 n=1 Tax=Geotrypetes seraphini TaxID=260995 RepID=A0A6P8PW51_GEOSA|nr:golgin subfamily A member 4 isoform X2 [Geotrypetes seraphini]
MFKKLKQKISEQEQQQQSFPKSSPPATGNRSRTSSLTDQQDEGSLTPDRENVSPVPRPTDNVNGSETANPQKSDVHSFAQRLHLRVPSMESLFRSPMKESLFRSSSKESLVRSASRESLNRLDMESPGPMFDPPSDIESEAEEVPGSLDGLSKEQIFQRLRQMERSLGNYRGKYSELVTNYRSLHREKEKLQSILSQSQDKALRRIGELREELQMDQQAKKHLQEEFDASLEEKDQLISVLQTQISLLKQRLVSGQMSIELPDQSAQPESETQSPMQEIGTENALGSGDGGSDASKTMEALQVRVRRQENLLQRCKEMIRSHKERSSQLSNEKEALQEQLEERFQELEKIKDLHTTEKTKLITQLRDAKNLVEQLEQDKGMVIAETKRQMHETLEMKEEEISQLCSRIKQMSVQCDELREQKEKSEKAAFEELEKALGASQKVEEKQRRGQSEMDEQIKAIEKASEEDRRSLQQELTRVKQEVVDIMKKSSEEYIAELEKKHANALSYKEQELKHRLQNQEEEFQERLKVALERARAERLKIIQEKEQQSSLALEELELQKKAMQSQNENQLQDFQQELETFRTRVLELESSLAKCSQDGKNLSLEMSTQIESLKNQHNVEIINLVAKHKEELDYIRKEQEQLRTEKLQLLKQEHRLLLEEIQAQHKQELEMQLKEKENAFHAHVKQMNEKTLEKLDVKQTELEALSAELSEAAQVRLSLEQKLSILENTKETLRQELEARLEQERDQYKMQIESIEKEHGTSAEGVEKALREEISCLKLLIEEKEKHLEELLTQEQKLKETAEKAETELKVASAKLEDACQWHQKYSNGQEQLKLNEAELTTLQQTLAIMEADKDHIKEQLTLTEFQLNNISTELESYKSQVQELKQHLEEQSSEAAQKLASLTQQYEYHIKDLTEEKEQANKKVTEKEEEIIQIKELQTQQAEDLKQQLSKSEEKTSSLQSEFENKLKSQESKMEKIKQIAKDMNETFKNKFSEQEIKHKKELEEKQLQYNEKEKQFNEKILEMAHASSVGIDDAVLKLELNQKEQLESLTETHRQKMEEVVESCKKNVNLRIEELQEKHEVELQEKEQELSELKQKLHLEEKEASKLIIHLKEEQGKKDDSLNELQEQLKQTSSQVSTLSQRGADLIQELEKLKADLNQALHEKTIFQTQLSEAKVTDEKYKIRVNELLNLLEATEGKLQTLETLHCKEHDDYEKKLENRLSEIQQKETELQKISEKITAWIEIYVSEAEVKGSEFNKKCNDKVNALLARILCFQKWTVKVKEAILIQAGRISELESQIEQIMSQHASLTCSLQQSVQHLQEKENQIIAMKDDLQCLMIEKDTLKKEGEHQQQNASEKEASITQLNKDLSENMNAVTSVRKELDEKQSQISSLDNLVKELKGKLENSVDLAEKEAILSILRKQHEEDHLKLVSQLQDLSSRLNVLNQEKTSALEQVDHWKNKFAEWKKKAEIKITQNHNTIKELQGKLEIHNKENDEKEQQLQRLKEDFDVQRTNLNSLKDEMGQMQTVKEKHEFDLSSALETQKARVAEMEEHVSRKTTENLCLMEDLKRHSQEKVIEREELIQQLRHLQDAGLEKDNRFSETEQKAAGLEKEIVSIKTELKMKEQEIEQMHKEMLRSKEEELKMLEDRLSTENAVKLAELKKKAEQRIAAIRKQLMSQIDEKEQCKKDLENQLQDLRGKMLERDARVKSFEEKIKSLENTFGLEKQEMEREVQNVKTVVEQEKTNTLRNLQQQCEEKINILQKDLMEKDELLQKHRAEQEEKNGVTSDMQKKFEELLKQLELSENNHQQDQSVIFGLQQELDEQNKRYSMLLDQQQEKEKDLAAIKEKLNDTEQKLEALENTIRERQKIIQEKEIIVKEMDGSATKKEEVHRVKIEALMSENEEKLKNIQNQLSEKDAIIKTLEERMEDRKKSDADLQKFLDDIQLQQKELKSKLEEAESEKQKMRKEVARLHKDLRSLRKEHQEELDIMKKEVADEMEEKLKHEHEDAELKHNSTLKQLMREFNTQLAQKEHELETVVQETISKAQEVEAELMQTHQIETSQLHRRITEKDDDLKRTVKKYEEILEAREEEMTAKVNELQAQLEQLQTKYTEKLAEEENKSSEDITVTELQTQLAQKTTLVNEAKLKEQEFREQVHTLEDQLKKYERNVFVTPLGMPYRADGNHRHTDVSVSAFGEPTEFEYLRKVLFEYMMGRETKTMAKVITTVLRFPTDQTQKILEREETRATFTAPRSGIF